MALRTENIQKDLCVDRSWKELERLSNLQSLNKVTFSDDKCSIALSLTARARIPAVAQAECIALLSCQALDAETPGS